MRKKSSMKWVAMPSPNGMIACLGFSKKRINKPVMRSVPTGVWRLSKKYCCPKPHPARKRSNLLISGIKDPMTISAISFFVVFAIIHPVSTCVNQSGIFIPPIKSDFFWVEFPRFKEKVQSEWYRRK